jgi:hypothetical protein
VLTGEHQDETAYWLRLAVQRLDPPAATGMVCPALPCPALRKCPAEHCPARSPTWLQRRNDPWTALISGPAAPPCAAGPASRAPLPAPALRAAGTDGQAPAGVGQRGGRQRRQRQGGGLREMNGGNAAAGSDRRCPLHKNTRRHTISHALRHTPSGTPHLELSGQLLRLVLEPQPQALPDGVRRRQPHKPLPAGTRENREKGVLMMVGRKGSGAQ